MYRRSIPFFDPEKFSATGSFRESQARDNSLSAVANEMAKYLAITAAIYLLLLTVLNVFKL